MSSYTMPRSLIALLMFAIICTAATSVQAAVSASLSEQIIDELETVRLTIRASQTRQTESLDLTALEIDFHVMGTNTSSQYSFVNGRERSWVDYQITLQPKRTGDLTIPSITVGQDATPTITLTVRPLTDETRQLIDELVFFEQDFSGEDVYVQGQLLITRRLLYSNGVQLYSDLPGAPEVDQAVVITLGDPVSSKVERNGQTYGVVEQRYAVFPELSGLLTIPPISLTASVRLINNGRVTRKGVRVGTEAASINVLPVPQEYPKDAAWIPAKDVQLHQVVTPDITEYKVGDTLEYELLVYVEGNLGSIAPPIPLNIDESTFRVYPQSPVIDDDPQRLGVVGSRLQTASVLPLQSGTHLIPESTLTWWDIDSKTVQVARWSPTRINVVGESVTNSAVVDKQTEATASETQPTDQTENADVSTSITAMNENVRDYLLILLALGAGLSVILLAIQRRNRTAHSEPGTSKAYYEAFNKLLKQGNADPKTLLEAVDRYLCAFYQVSPPLARRRFAEQHPAVEQALQTLNRAAYADPLMSDTQTQASDAEQAAATLASYLAKLPTKNERKEQDLPPLYPHQRAELAS
ncbi:MAG: BatD family protein [Pseudomonadota bacterium]